MGEEKFQIRLDWEKMNKEELSLYIHELHSYLMEFQTSSIHQMIISLDNIAQKICDDLDIIAEGRTDGLVILSDEKDSKIYDRLMTLISRVKDWKEVSKLAEAIRPEVAKLEKQAQEKIKVNPDSNIFEQLQELALKRKKGL